MGRRRQQDLTPFEVSVESLEREGLGRATRGERPVLIHGALAGEEILAEPARGRHKPRRAFTREVRRPSSLRVAPPCEHHEVCGGCSLQHMSLVGQRAHKQAVLAGDFASAGVTPERWLPPRVGASLGYRRRARLGVRYVKAKDEVLVGFRERMDRRFIARMDRCPVLRAPADDLITPLATLIRGMSIRHAIPQVEVSISRNCCVLIFRVLEPLNDADRARLLEFSDAHGVRVYVQTGGLDTIVPLDPSQTARLTYEVDGLELAFEPTSFVQVHEEMNEALVAAALDLLDLRPGQRVLDLFCGLGNFTLPLARRGVEAHGVEGDEGLVELGRANASHNGLQATFTTQDLYRDPEAGTWLQESWDRVLLDPPRTGAEAVVRALGDTPVARIVYVACGPESLARDAAILVRDHGFRLAAAGIVDMFPHTAHFESIALFQREPGSV